jgi:RNA polymerase sigma factor (TIGR02999 family)
LAELGDITRLLKLVATGDKSAEDALTQITYAELRRLALSFRRRERAELSLQATDLVHEVYLKVLSGKQSYRDSQHFFRVASRVMRHLLVDHARRRTAQKRGGENFKVPLDEFLVADDAEADEILWMHEALTKLETLYPRPARVVELHFFCGLTMDEIGGELDISAKTADRDWSMAKSWLRTELG